MRALTFPNYSIAATLRVNDRLLGCLLAVVILILRLPYIGYPEIHFDEQFYLLVGDRVLHGQIPYVDVWDRKPVGLFLLFATIRSLGGDGYVQYQIVAAIFVLITCWFLILIARRYVSTTAAFACAIGYAGWLSSIGGEGGQSPVFYNCLTAIAGYMTLRAIESEHAQQSRRWAFLSMAMCGLILQLKYTAVAEGIFFGLALLWDQYIRKIRSRDIIEQGIAMIAIALAPTIAVMVYYAIIGALDIFVYANFISVFDRMPQPDFAVAKNLKTLAFIGLPLILSLPVAVNIWIKSSDNNYTRNFVLGWFLAAIVGFSMIGNFFDHYALPLLMPVFLLLAPAFDRKNTGPLIFFILMCWAIFIAHQRIMPKNKNIQMIAAMESQIKPYTDRGATLYIDDGSLILYLETGAKAPWRFLFPFHLTDATERNAIGIDTHEEMRKLVAARPGVIITASAAFTPLVDQTNRHMLDDLIRSDYENVGQFDRWQRRYLINVRSDLVAAHHISE